MADLNDLRVFERVAALKSFSAAAGTLDLPKSSVSRSVRRLEADLATPLLRRTTREVTLTEAGIALFDRCAGLLEQLDQALEVVGSLREGPRGCLRISAGIGFGINVLAELLPAFAQRYPKVNVALDLSSDLADLVGERFDVAIRFGDLPDSSTVGVRLGTLHRYLCASPAYLAHRGTPADFEDLRDHDLIAFPAADGRQPPLVFRKGGETVEHRQGARFSVNCALTIHRLILNGAGIGLSSAYLCGPEIVAGRMVRLFTGWTLPSVPVHAVFPSHWEQVPSVRAFLDFMRENCWDGHDWQADPIASPDRGAPGCDAFANHPAASAMSLDPECLLRSRARSRLRGAFGSSAEATLMNSDACWRQLQSRCRVLSPNPTPLLQLSAQPRLETDRDPACVRSRP